MACKKVQSSTDAWALAIRQHGVVTRAQLLELGFSRRAVQHRVAKGRLHPVFSGVFAVGRPELTQHGRWMAAVLACGPDAVLSHHSAAALWEITQSRISSIAVSVPAQTKRMRSGIDVHRRTNLRPAGTTKHD